MPNQPVQIVDNLALVPLTATEVASVNMQSLGVITITSGGGGGDMLKANFATINPGAGFVDKALTSSQVPYTGLTTLPGGTTTFLRADGTFASPPGQTYAVASIAAAGLAPSLPSSSGSSYYLRGDASWQLVSSISLAYSQLTGIPLTFAPVAHATQHITSGNDVIPLATATKSGLVPILPASSPTLNFLRGDSTWAQIPNVTGVAPGLMTQFPGTLTTFFRGDGTYAIPAYGSLSGVPSTFTPALHASQHITGGNDIIPNFSIGGIISGLVPGSPGGTVNYLRADGTWSAPPGGGGLATSSGAGLMAQLQPSAQNTYYCRGDNSWQLISTLSIAYAQVTGVPVFAGGSAGLVPNSVGGTINFLRADGVFAAPPGSGLATTASSGLVPQLPASAGATFFLRGDNSWQLISSQSIPYSQLTGVPATFTPSSHQTTHVTGGSDVIPAPTITKSGLVPILPSTNPTLTFLRGDASWAVVPVATASASGLVPAPPNLTTQWLRGDATFSAIPTVGPAAAGLAPAFPNNATTFFRGDGTYVAVSYASLTGTPATFSPSAHATQHITAGNDIIPNFTATASGLVPLSGGGVANFLRADGTWQTPSGAGDVFHTRQILTTNSIIGGGDLSIDHTHMLVGDLSLPGNWQLYSTNGSGVRGWNASNVFPAATALAAGLVPTPPNNATQFLSGLATFLVPPTFTSTTVGYVPSSGGGTLNFLRADGAWAQPPDTALATTSIAGAVPQLQVSGSSYYLRGDNSWQLISGLSIAYGQITGVPIFSGTATAGLVPGSSGSASTFLRGDGAFASPPLAASATAGYISGLPAPNSTAYWARGDNSWQLLPTNVFVTSPWTMPTVGTTVSGVTVTDTSILKAGMSVLTGAVAATQCLMEINSVTDATHLVLVNRGYAFNPSSGTSIPGGLMAILGPSVSTATAAGFVPPPPNDAAKFLNGTGIWSVPPGSSGTVSSQFSVTGDGSAGNKLQLLNDQASPGPFKFYSTDALGAKAWLPLSYSWETNATFVTPGIGATQNILLTSNAGITAGTTLVIEDSTVPPNQGFFEVVSVNGDLVHIVIRNPGYALNSIPGTVFATNAAVTLAGPGVSTGTTPGFVPTPPNNTTTFLRGDSAFATPANVSISAPGYVPTAPNSTTQFLRGDATWAVPTLTQLATTGVQGAVVGLSASNQATSFLRGDNSWQLISSIAIAYSQLTGVPSTFTPTAHATQHITGGNDVISNFSTSSATSGLVPGSVTGGTTNFLRADGTWTAPPNSGLATTSSAGQIAQLPPSAGNTYYARGDNTWQLISGLSIAYSQLTGVPSTFTPAAHASTHLDNGSDPIAVVAGLRTGLVPILPAAAPTTKFLRGDATWTVIPGVTSGASGLVPAFPNNTTTFFRGDGSYAAVPIATATAGGLVPTPPNLTYKWLRGDATWVTIPFYWNISASFTQPAIAANVSVTFTSTTALVAGMVISTVDLGNLTNVYSVSSITNATTAVLTNLGCQGNASAASTVNAGQASLVGPPVLTATGAGIVPVPPNNTTSFLRGDGTWAVPAASGVPSNRLVSTQYSLEGGGDLSADRTLNLVHDTANPGFWQLYSTDGSGTRGWNASTALPVATTSNAGLLPTLAGGTTTFLRADGAWSAPASLAPASTGTAGTVVGLPASNQTSQWLRADNSWQFLPDSNVTTGSWTMPAIGATVAAVTFNSTANWDAGMTLFFATGAAATCCFMEVDTVSSATQLILRNLGYASNPVATTVIPTSMVFVVSPGVATSTLSGLVPTPPNSTTQFLRGDATFATPPSATATVAGYVPTPPNNTTTFLRGDATFTAVDYGSLSNTPLVQLSTSTTASYVQPAVGGTVSVTVSSSTGFSVGRGIIIIGGGYYPITGVADGTHITVLNNGYTYNVASGNTVASANSVIAASNANLFSSTVAGDVPLSGGGTANFLRADGTWSAIPAATATTSGLVPTPPNNTTTFLRGDATFAAIPAATATTAGLVPTPPNSTTQWLRGDATWAVSPPLTLTTTATFTWPAVGGTVAIQVASSSLMKVGMGLYFPALGVAELTVVTDATHITIRNNGNSGNAGSTAGVAIGTAIYVGGGGSLATATTSGDVPTPPNNTTTFLRGDATFSTPPTATATTAGYVSPPNNTTTFYRGDATFSGLPTNSTAQAGTVATSPNDTNEFYRGDSTWSFLPNQTETNGTFTVPAAGATVAITVVSAAWTAVGQTLFITDGTRIGFFEITVRTSATALTVKNQGYQGNSTSGTMATASIVQLVGPSIVTSTQPGFVPVPPNNTTTYLRGDGTFSAVPAATATVSGLVPTPPNNTTTFLRGDATFATPPSATATVAGYVPTPPNNTTTFLRGDATFAAPTSPVVGTTTNGTFTVPASGSTVVVTIVAATWPLVGQKIYISDGAGGHTMYGNITAVGSSTSITVRNTGDTGNSTSGTMATAAGVHLVGFQNLMFKQWQAALEYSPPTSLYAVFGVQNARAHLAYNDSATWTANFHGVCPAGTYLGAGLTARLKWKSITVATGNAVWGAAISRLNATEASDSFDTQVTATAAVSGTTSVLVETSIAITTINSLVAGDPFILQVQRLGANGSDTLVGDSCLRFVSIESTV